MGEAKQRKQRYGDLYGTRECPGAGLRTRVVGRYTYDVARWPAGGGVKSAAKKANLATRIREHRARMAPSSPVTHSTKRADARRAKAGWPVAGVLSVSASASKARARRKAVRVAERVRERLVKAADATETTE